MFDLNSDETRVIKDHPEARMESHDDEAQEQPEHELDSPQATELHGRLMSYYRQELSRQAENRFHQAVEEDYKDNIQWTEEEAALLRERGQEPIVYNVIANSINWITGSEKRGRTDFKILPRRKDGSKAAEHKTNLMKYISDVNRTPFHRSRAFEDSVCVGIGWLEDAVQDEDDGEPVYSRYESWRNMLWDSAATELDMSDGRYIFRSKWIDLDIAIALFPERREILESAVIENGLYGGTAYEDGDPVMDFSESERDTEIYSSGAIVTHNRKRVRLIEAWFKVPETTKKIRGGEMAGDIFDENDPNHVEQVNMGVASIVERPMMRTHCAIMTVNGLLYESVSPYRHNRFPFTPVWGFRRGRDGMPYGLIRLMKDVQNDINKRMSKALYILSSNKVVMDKGAVDDLDEFTEEVARPDAVIVKNKGFDLVINAERDLAQPHIDLVTRGIQFLQQIGGVTDELLGRSTNAVSGVAIQARQEQGSVATNKFFDNLRLAVQMQGEIQLSLIEQFFTEPKEFRITNARGVPSYITVNDGLPENNITRTKADFIISESEWRISMRQAAVDQLVEMLSKMPPQVALVMLDLVVDSMDVPNREEIVKRIRQVNGQRDPDATEPTPEEIQAMQAAQRQAQIQEAMVGAELADKQAKALKTQAETARIVKQTVGDNVGAMKSAMEAAQIVAALPIAAELGDAMLEEAGWNQAQQPGPAIGLPPPPPPPPSPEEQQAMQEAEQSGAAPMGGEQTPEELPPDQLQQEQ